MKLYKIVELEVTGESTAFVLADSEEEALKLIEDSKWDFTKPEVHEVTKKGVVTVVNNTMPD